VIAAGGRRGLALGVIVTLAVGCRGRRTPTPVAARDAGDAGAIAVVDGAVGEAVGADRAPGPDGAVALAEVEPGYRVIDTAGAAAVTVTVRWPAAPPGLRGAPGRTPCGGPRPPRVRLATLHGVADAVVVLEVGAGKPPPPAGPVRLTVRDCLVAPAVALAPGLGGAIEIQSADERAATVVATDLGPAWSAAAAPAPAPPPRARAHLPVLGHTVALAAAPGALRVALDGQPTDGAIAIAPPHPYVAITDDAGVARFAAVPPGTYPVAVWLPARAGDGDRRATGQVVVAADDVSLEVELE
jgi:hypothetical protein